LGGAGAAWRWVAVGGEEEAEEGVDEDALDGGEIDLVFDEAEEGLEEVLLQGGVAPVLLVELLEHEQHRRGVLR
jgi:hypothetical protein